MLSCTLLFATLAAASPFRPVGDEGPRPAAQGSTREARLNGDTNGVADLPYAFGRTFQSLDQYLAHLERRARPIDLPWWRQVGPGLYERVKRMPGAEPERATRAELMERFGFSE